MSPLPPLVIDNGGCITFGLLCLVTKHKEGLKGLCTYLNIFQKDLLK